MPAATTNPFTGEPLNSFDPLPAYREEFFGTLASLFRVSGIGDAIRIANDSRFRLGASAWTNDAAERERFVDELLSIPGFRSQGSRCLAFVTS